MTVSWVNVVASNIGSFVLGVLVCLWLTRRAAAAANRITDHVHDHSEVTMPARRNALMPLPARVIVLVLVGALTFGLGVRVGYEVLASKVSCFNDYANKNADAQERRSEATEALQQADKEFKKAVVTALTPGADHEDFEAVRLTAQQSLAKQRELAKQRRTNPYPDPPREVC